MRGWTTRALAAAAALALLGCSTESADASATGREASTADAPRPAALDRPAERPSDFVIQGEATYEPRVKMPPGASLTVELVAADAAASAGPVASTTVRDVAGPPIPFALPYDAAAVRADARHALRAVLLGPDGETWFRTAAPVPVVPGEGVPVTLEMQRVDADEQAAKGGSTARVSHWTCEELGVMVRPGDDPWRLRVSANGRDWTLARDSDGTRYRDDSGNTYLSSGTKATFSIAGEPSRTCVRADRPSPWNAALLEGLGFRAVGNEPGWYVEVGKGESPRLRAVVDYGERVLEIPGARPAGNGFRGVTKDGTQVSLSIDDGRCTDGMSGQVFEAGATLTVGRRTYRGCGAFLGA